MDGVQFDIQRQHQQPEAETNWIKRFSNAYSKPTNELDNYMLNLESDRTQLEETFSYRVCPCFLILWEKGFPLRNSNKVYLVKGYIYDINKKVF